MRHVIPFPASRCPEQPDVAAAVEAVYDAIFGPNWAELCPQPPQADTRCTASTPVRPAAPFLKLHAERNDDV